MDSSSSSSNSSRNNSRNSSRNSNQEDDKDHHKQLQNALRFMGFEELPATQQEIDTQYRKLALKYHPDHHPDVNPLQMKLLNEYRELLRTEFESQQNDTIDFSNIIFVYKTGKKSKSHSKSSSSSRKKNKTTKKRCRKCKHRLPSKIHSKYKN